MNGKMKVDNRTIAAMEDGRLTALAGSTPCRLATADNRRG